MQPNYVATQPTSRANALIRTSLSTGMSAMHSNYVATQPTIGANAVIMTSVLAASAMQPNYVATQPTSAQARQLPNMSVGDGQDTMMSILSQLVNLQQQTTLPKPDIDYFDGGDVLSFASFTKNFKSLVEDITPSPVRRLEMLIKYTRGDAKSLIKDCILMEDPNEAYQRAVALLQTHYGHPATIATAYRQKAEAWSSI